MGGDYDGIGRFGCRRQTPVPTDVYEFALAIAEPTANAKIGGGDQHYERYVLFGRNPDGEIGVTGIGVLSHGEGVDAPSGTIGALLVHYEGQCGAPHGADDRTVGSFTTLVASPSGKHILEIAQPQGVTSIRLVESADKFGAWEPYHPDPKAYVTYACGKFR